MRLLTHLDPKIKRGRRKRRLRIWRGGRWCSSWWTHVLVTHDAWRKWIWKHTTNNCTSINYFFSTRQSQRVAFGFPICRKQNARAWCHLIKYSSKKSSGGASSRLVSDLCEFVSVARSQQMTFEGKINYSITGMEICLSSGLLKLDAAPKLIQTIQSSVNLCQPSRP